MKVVLKNVRLSFCDLFTPVQFKGTGDAKYKATFILVPGSPADLAASAAVAAVAKETWKDKARVHLAEISRLGKTSYKTDPLANSDGEVYGGFEGMHSVSSSSKTPPTVVDRDRSQLNPASGLPYPGCYVNAIIDLWAQDNTFGRRINCELKGVQFSADGEAFKGSAPARADEFEVLGFDSNDDLPF